MDLHDDVSVVALGELREVRRQRRIGEWSAIDALYKAYVSGIAAAVFVTMLSGVVGDDRLDASAVAQVRLRGAAVIGVLIALTIALALRTGARGGPVALEPPDVRHVMMAPVDRDLAVRPPALCQLRFAAFAGTVTGATAGLLAYRRFPGAPAAWVVSGAVVGMAAGVSWAGAAMAAAGMRLDRRRAAVIGALVLASSMLDIVLVDSPSPASMIGAIALWPISFRPVTALGLVVPAVLAAAGLKAIGGMSLEAAERRARLVSHLRFAATFQDVNTVLLLRRQLAAELPRPAPWVRLRPARRGPVVWRRDWRGILRWPAARVLRLPVLGAVAGLATAAAWAGTTAMVVVAGGALFLVALDAVEGLAEEIDHPDRRNAFPLAAGAIHLRHLAAPLVVVVAVALVGVAAAAVAGGGRLALEVGLPLVVPAAAMATAAAAVSVVRDPPDMTRLMLDLTGTQMMFRVALPPALATAGPAAAVLVRYLLDRPGSTAPVASLALTAALEVALVAVVVAGWVRHRDAVTQAVFGGGAPARGVR